MFDVDGRIAGAIQTVQDVTEVRLAEEALHTAQVDLERLATGRSTMLAHNAGEHSVQDLKDFSRVDANLQWEWADLHQGIDSTLNIVNNEIKYKADIVKEYGEIPEIECLPSQINQVIMNIVVNAAQAIGEERGCITIRTGGDERQVWVEISDTGSGIAKENLSRIFDPFFTTKPVGQGTGLGSRFRVVLPIRHPAGEQKRL